MSGPNGEGLYVDYARPVVDKPEVPEQVYLDAARLNVAQYYAEVNLHDPERAEATARRVAQRADFRAAVESAYRAGYQAGFDRDDFERHHAARESDAAAGL